MLGMILLINSCFAYLDYYKKKEFLLPNIVIILIVVAFLLLLVRFSNKISKVLDKINIDKVVIALTVVLLVLQLIICYNVAFFTAWDPGWCIIPKAKSIAFHTETGIDWYFYKYPNTYFLTTLFAVIFKVENTLWGLTGDDLLTPIIILNCIINTLTCYLLYRTIKRLINEKYAFAGFIFAFLWFGLTPWNVVCYSDELGLIIPLLIFNIYINKNEKSIYWRYALMGALCYVGYKLKPQISIMFIAIMLCELYIQVQKVINKSFKIKNVMLVIICLAVTFIVMNTAMEKVLTNAGFNTDPKERYGMSHYLMMGLGNEKDGGFSDDDVNFSGTFETKKERNIGDLKEALRRVKEYKLGGLIKHKVRKSLVNFNDGTFAWSEECEDGEFYYRIYELPNENIAPVLRSYYYEAGTNYKYFIMIKQFYWMAALILMFINSLSELFIKEDKKDNINMSVLVLSVVGLFIFEMLFEARARYLYTYAPVFVILMVSGIRYFKIFRGKNVKN